MRTLQDFVSSPASKAELLAELARAEAACAELWDGFPADEFFAPIGEAWSPADNVRHLTKSVRPVARALRLPRPLLLLLFGVARRPSRALDALVADYRSRLDAGGTAGRFAPSPLALPDDREGRRRELLGRFAAVQAELRDAVGPWSERALDRCRLPHPLLGKLTVREMLLFTLYHGVHHARNVARRKGLA